MPGEDKHDGSIGVYVTENDDVQNYGLAAVMVYGDTVLRMSANTSLEKALSCPKSN
jgi:hypothetical protein